MRIEQWQFVKIDNQKYIILEVFKDGWVRIQLYKSYKICSDEDTMTIHEDSLLPTDNGLCWRYDEELDQLAF